MRHAQLLILLSDGKFKTFSQLSALLKCSKIHIKQTVNKLEAQGIAQFIKENEYLKLKIPLALLKSKHMQKLCPNNKIEVLITTQSTNTYLLNKKSRKKGEVVLAEWQSAGRGRTGKKWLSPFAGQLIMSMYWQYHSKMALEGLSVRLGIATAKALREMGFLDVMLKWPNDLYLYGRKLGGILPEITSRGKKINVVAGIGINLIPPPQIDQKTAYLQELGEINRQSLTARIINAWQKEFLKSENEPIDYKLWSEFDIYAGQPVVLLEKEKKFLGINCGIDSLGRILIENNGKVSAFCIGEMSLRANDF